MKRKKMIIGKYKIVILITILKLFMVGSASGKEAKKLVVFHEDLELLDLVDVRTGKIITFFTDLTEQKDDPVIQSYRRIQREKVLLLFWSVKSKQSINSLLAMSHSSKKKPLPIVIGICLDRPNRRLRKLIRGLKLSFPIIYDQTHFFSHYVFHQTCKKLSTSPCHDHLQW